MLKTTEATLDPADWQEFRQQSHRMLDDMIDHIEKLRDGPVWQPVPDAVRQVFRQPLPVQSGDLSEAHDTFMQDVLPYAVGNAHPGFMGWVHGGGTPVGMLAEMLAAGLNANLGGRNQMPVEVERQLVNWVSDLFGFPETASGLFVTGTSMANLISVLVARSAALGQSVRHQGLADGHKLVSYTSVSAHLSIAQALDMAGIGMAALRSIPVNDKYQMDVDALQRSIAADKAAGLMPFFIVATAGTVDVGSIDPLAAIADIAQREQIWFHVDGAFGALGMLAADVAPLLQGIQRADSIAFDFHKWGQVPYDAGFVLIRDGELHRSTFASPAAYLRRDTRGMAADSPWPCDFGPDMSRGFRALKTWFTLQVYGTEKLGQVISNTCKLARYLQRRVEAAPELELLAPVALNIVCFRFCGVDADALRLDKLNGDIVIAIQESGIAAPSSTTINGKFAIRAAIVNHRTTSADIDALVEAVLAFGAGYINHEETMTNNLITQPLIGLASLMRMAFSGVDLAPLGTQLIERAGSDSRQVDTNALMDLSTVLQLRGERELALEMQAQALCINQLYASPYLRGQHERSHAAIRLLAIMGAGDLMSNSPVEFLLEDADVALDVVYVTEELALPDMLPEHDVLFVAIAESERNIPLLRKIATATANWPRPVLNDPARIALLSRDNNCSLLKGADGVDMPLTARLFRQRLEQVGRSELPLSEVLESGTFPVIVRPVDSHAGKGLDKLDDVAALLSYLANDMNGAEQDEFYVSRFVDYRDADGMFRKYRIMLVGGHPYVAHMGISEHWMIHYLNAGMAESAEKRDEEARFMADFDAGFAVRHAAAFQAIFDRAGLDYLGIDCAETADGKLLIFEIDSCMIVHAIDPVDVFPYKQLQMHKLFDAFSRMLRQAAEGG